MIEDVIIKFITEILILLAGSIISIIVYFHNKIYKIEKIIYQLKQRLYGYERDSSDKGFIIDIENKVKKMDNQIDDIDEKLDEIIDKINDK